MFLPILLCVFWRKKKKSAKEELLHICIVKAKSATLCHRGFVFFSVALESIIHTFPVVTHREITQGIQILTALPTGKEPRGGTERKKTH